jgi:hypothetical protein
MFAVLLKSKESGLRPHSGVDWAPAAGARVLAEFAGNDRADVLIVELGGSLRSVSRRVARHGNARAVQVDTIQQGFDLARKAIEGSGRLTSCARSRSGNW